MTSLLSMSPTGGAPPSHGLPAFVSKGRALPNRFDVAAKFLGIRDQENRQTCVAFACCAALEYLVQSPGHISPQHAYYLAKNADGRPNTPGTYLSVGVAQAQGHGFWDEYAWPYEPNQPAVEHGGPPPHHTSKRHQRNAHEIRPATDVQLLKEALVDGLGVVLTLEASPDWFVEPTSAWISGELRNPNILGKVSFAERHAVCLVGYDDRYKLQSGAQGALRFKNSWGRSFGASGTLPGYGWLSYDLLRSNAVEAFAVG